MRTILSTEDIKNIIEQEYNGTLSQNWKPYENPNSEQIVLIDEYDGTQTETDLATYLNIKFYTFKERVDDEDTEPQSNETTFQRWVKSLNYSLNNAYALVEVVDEEATASQDIDNATKIGTISFLIQANKIKNLDYYTAKIRNALLGNPQTIQNSYGDLLTAYLTLGTLNYAQELTMTQVGECVIVTCGFKLSYLSSALTYADTQVEISLNGDDLYNAEGQIVDTNGEPTATKYLTMPLTKLSAQNIFALKALPTVVRPDLTGFVATSISFVTTLTFFDFNKELTLQFNDLFWKTSAFRYDGVLTTVQNVNIPVYIRITSNGHSYVYSTIIDNMQKAVTNSDFNISSITLKGWGKVGGQL